jgi:hypothetical protein
VSKNKITSYEQIREAFLNLRNKALGFLLNNKEKIEFLFDYLNRKKNEEKKESQTELRNLYTSKLFLLLAFNLNHLFFKLIFK